MEYAGEEGLAGYAGEGPGGISQQGNRTVIEGGDSRFVVEYKYDDSTDAASRSPSLEVQGGNNEFVLRVDGSAGGSDINIEGGNSKFVIVFDNASGGGNTVRVDGGNNQFVVRFDYSVGQGEGDIVTVNGANNQYAVETNYTDESGPTSNVAVAGPSGGFGTLPGGQEASSNGGSYDFSAFGNSASSPLVAMFGGGAAAGNEQGGEPGRVYDFSAFEDTTGAGSGDEGLAGGNPFGGGGNPFAGGEGTSGQGSDLSSLLAQSPFGRLLDLPGIEGPDDIFGNVAGNFSGENPFAGTNAMPGTNPFAGFGGGANPFAGGAGGGQNSGYDVSAPNNQAAGGDEDATSETGGNNPFAGGGAAGGNPFANLATGGQPSNPDYDFSGLQLAGGGDPAAAFAASPFGPLIGLPGIDGPEDIFGEGFAAAFGGGEADTEESEGDVVESGDDAQAAPVPEAEFSPIG